MAGACEILVTFPLDTVKTQMQLNPTKYRHIGHAINTIVAQNGVKGLYFGMPAMLTQVCPARLPSTSTSSSPSTLFSSSLGLCQGCHSVLRL